MQRERGLSIEVQVTGDGSLSKGISRGDGE